MAHYTTNPLPKGWTILGLALASWGAVIAAAQIILHFVARLTGI